MFDIGWTEMIVVAIVAILVVGPKDLPKMLRAFGKTMANLRSMAGEFQSQFNDALKEAELDEVKDLASGKGFQPLEDARKSMQAFQKNVTDSVKELEAMPDEGSGDGAKTLNGASTKTAAKAAATAPAKTGSAATKRTSAKKPATKKAPARKPSQAAKPATKPAAQAKGGAKAQPKAQPKAKPAAAPRPAKSPSKAGQTARAAKSGSGASA